MANIYDMTLPELIERGWLTTTDDKTGLTAAIRSTIPDWTKLTWAQQTYYKAKYRFNANGILEIELSEVRSQRENPVLNFVRDLVPDQNVTPDAALAGSNQRLKEYLENDRVNLEPRSYDETALVHIGLDGSAIYTNDAGWGPPLNWPNEKTFLELDERKTCRWEIDSSWVSAAPCWICPECNGF